MIKNNEKKRAPLNRTITLSEDEIKKYSKKLSKINYNIPLKDLQNKIINQDIFEVLNYLPDNFIDLLFIDPPYNLYRKFNSISFSGMNNAEYEKWLDSWLSKMIRMIKEDASIYVCCDWKSSTPVYNVISKYFIVRNRITWEREKGRGAKKNWKNCSEDIWFCTKSDNFKFNIENVKIRRRVIAPYKENGKPKDWQKEDSGNFRITYPSNLWTDISVPFWSMPENTDHPTQKPEKLLAKIILASSDKDNLIFDPFAGSGTTAVVAKKLGRKYAAIELDEYFCCLAEKRLELAELDNSIQGYRDGVFWERNTFPDQKKNNKKNQ